MKNQFLLFCWLFLATYSAHALTPSDFTITRVTAPYFVVDGNSPTIVTKAYVGFEVKNTSASPISGLIFSIDSIKTNVTGQNYSVLAPTSSRQLVGTLAPGASKVCYFFVSYPASVSPTGTFYVRLYDNTATAKSQTFPIYNRSSISANAGGLTTVTVNNQDLLGGIISFDVTYTVGNAQNNDEVDFQVATSTSFVPTKVNLLSTSIVSSSLTNVNSGVTDSLYFITGNSGVGSTVTVRWTFRIIDYNFTNYFLPLAGATSGSTNYKYAINTSLGSGVAVTVSNTNPLTIAKSSNKSVYTVCEQATFTLTVTNNGAYGITVDSLLDQLPTGFTFVGFDGTGSYGAADCIQYPAAGATGNIKFIGGVTSGLNSSFFIPANSSRTIKYTATAPCTATGNLSTTVGGLIGPTQFGTANNSVAVTWALPVTWNGFTVKANGSNALLEWSTLAEQQACCYLIQYSKEGNSFETVNSIPAQSKGSYRSIQSQGTGYYRIVLKDQNGNLNYSKTLYYQSGTKASGLLLSSMVQDATLRVSLTESTMLEILGTDGRVVLRTSMEAGNQSLNISALPKGMYLVRANQQTTRFTKL